MRDLILLMGVQNEVDTSGASPWDVARSIHGVRIEGYPVLSFMLPHASAPASRATEELLEAYEPKYSMCLGPFDRGCRAIIPQVAINAADILPFGQADAAAPVRRVVATDNAAYGSRLPVDAICRSLRFAKCPSEAPVLAGEGLSNGILFSLLHVMNTTRTLQLAEGGLVRLPWASDTEPAPAEVGTHEMKFWTDAVAQILTTMVVVGMPVGCPAVQVA